MLGFARLVEMEDCSFILDVCGTTEENSKQVILELAKGKKNVYCKKETLAKHKIENEFNQGFAKMK